MGQTVLRTRAEAKRVPAAPPTSTSTFPRCGLNPALFVVQPVALQWTVYVESRLGRLFHTLMSDERITCKLDDGSTSSTVHPLARCTMNLLPFAWFGVVSALFPWLLITGYADVRCRASCQGWGGGVGVC